MGLFVLQWNAQGIKSHFPYFYNYIFSLPHLPDVICIQESHLTSDQSFSLKGYHKPIRKDRETQRWGGVLALIKNNLVHSELFCPPDIEAVGIQIQSASEILNIFNIYNPGIDISVDQYCKFFISNSLICGDFNAHHPLWGGHKIDKRGQIMESLITNSNHVLLNNGQGTHIINAQRTSPIDLTVVSSNLSANSHWSVGDDPLHSDHYPITITLGFCPAFSSQSPAWNLKKTNWKVFSDLMVSSFNPTSSDDVNIVHNDIIQTIHTCMNKASPTVPSNTKYPNQVPYWNNECEQACRTKNKLRRKASRTKLLQDHIEYKKSKAKCTKIVKSRRRQYWRDYCSSLNRTSNLSTVWRMVKKMNNSKSFQPIPTLTQNDQHLTSNLDKANVLAQQFGKVSSTANYAPDFLTHKSQFAHQYAPSLSFQHFNDKVLNGRITYYEVKTAIDASKISTPGPDNISYLVYKKMPKSSVVILQEFFNFIWHTGTLPEAWKQAIITPIPKPGKDSSDPSSYRPISLTSTMCKLMERIIVNRLNWFCEKHNLFNKFQSGFRKGRSTLDHILHLHQDINNSLHNKGKALAVFLDIEKAYDMVWRDGLLFKLTSLGIDGQMFNWIKSFLTGRSFQVKVANELSDTVVQENGVPQGSVISPILFIIMINDATTFSDPSIKYACYADDVVLWKCGRNFSHVNKCVQTALDQFAYWCSQWGFKISVNKSVGLPFSRSKVEVQLTFNNHLLSIVNNYKFLGVIFDAKLTWNQHIDYVYHKCLKRINILKCVSGTSWGASKSLLVILYKSLIRSVLDYGSVVYDYASTSYLKKLNSIQNRCLRICCGALKITGSQLLEVECGIPPLYLQRKSLQLKYTTRTLVSQLPVDLFSKGWQYFYGSYASHNSPFINKIEDFFCQVSFQDIGKHKALPIPLWDFPDLIIDTSLSRVGKKQDHPQVLLSLAYAKIGRYSDHIHVYTDGSKMDEISSAAFYVKQLNYHKSYQLPSCSIYKAELFAILQSLIWIEHSGYQHYLICSDSLSSLFSLQSRSSASSPSLLMEVLIYIRKLVAMNIEICFLWIPSHIGILGNEFVDQLAKDAITTAPTFHLQMDLRDIYRKINLFILHLWQTRWSQNKSLYIKIVPQVSYGLQFTDPNRRKEVMLTRLRFDKTTLNGHLYRIGCHPTGNCDLCNAFQDPQHVFMDCIFYHEFQQELIQSLFNKNLPINYVSVLSNSCFYNSIYKFLVQSKIAL